MSTQTEIIPGLYLIPGENGGRFPLSPSFLVDDSICALIDTGCGESVIDSIRREHRI